jgi:hypothetical protein
MAHCHIAEHRESGMMFSMQGPRACSHPFSAAARSLSRSGRSRSPWDHPGSRPRYHQAPLARQVAVRLRAIPEDAQPSPRRAGTTAQLRGLES